MLNSTCICLQDLVGHLRNGAWSMKWYSETLLKTLLSRPAPAVDECPSAVRIFEGTVMTRLSSRLGEDLPFVLLLYNTLTWMHGILTGIYIGQCQWALVYDDRSLSGSHLYNKGGRVMPYLPTFTISEDAYSYQNQHHNFQWRIAYILGMETFC